MTHETATRRCLACRRGPHPDTIEDTYVTPHRYDPGDRRELPPPANLRPDTGHRRRWGEARWDGDYAP